MFGINWQWTKAVRGLFTSVMAVIMVLGVTSCGDRPSTPPSARIERVWQTPEAINIQEVSPPRVIQQLKKTLEVYQPQVKILSPQPDEQLQDDTVTVEIEVEDLPLFKDPQLGAGPYLEVILDNQSYTRIYDLKKPLVLADLPLGTHTLGVFAARPWGESFKNEGAYAQTTFDIFTKTQDNNPDPEQPLLTYNSPLGRYGAEPILLDFYLTGAPLHLVALENPDDDILDWRIRCTINGESFYLDQWQPLYLKGFKPGKNWLQLELIDELGRNINNQFNNTVKLITYEPKGQDTLSLLVRGELTATAAQGIVAPSSSTREETSEPLEAIGQEEIPLAEPDESTPAPGSEPAAETSTTVPTEVTVEPASTPEPESKIAKFSRFFKDLFSRFGRPAASDVTPAPNVPEDESSKVISPSPEEPASVPAAEETPPSEVTPSIEPAQAPETESRKSDGEKPAPVPAAEETPQGEVTPSIEPAQAPETESRASDGEKPAPVPAAEGTPREVKSSIEPEQAAQTESRKSDGENPAPVPAAEGTPPGEVKASVKPAAKAKLETLSPTEAPAAAQSETELTSSKIRVEAGAKAENETSFPALTPDPEQSTEASTSSSLKPAEKAEMESQD